MSDFVQLSPAFPTEEDFVAAYSRGTQPEYLVVGKTLKGRNLELNGARHVLQSGDVLIAFPWKCNQYRIPGIGFKHCSEIWPFDNGWMEIDD